jgi:hypothetical protein
MGNRYSRALIILMDSTIRLKIRSRAIGYLRTKLIFKLDREIF